MNDKVELSWLLQQISAIQSDTGYLHETIQQLSQMGDGDSGDCGAPGNLLGKAKAEALGDIVRCRETTNQQLLRLYEKMYDDCVQGSRRQADAAFHAELMRHLEEVKTAESRQADAAFHAELAKHLREVETAEI